MSEASLAAEQDGDMMPSTGQLYQQYVGEVEFCVSILSVSPSAWFWYSWGGAGAANMNLSSVP